MRRLAAPQPQQPSPSPQDFGDAFGRHFTGAIVIGGHLRDEGLSIYRRVKNDHRDLLARGAIDPVHHYGFVNRGDTNCVHTLIDHRIQNLQLPREVSFGGGPVPDEIDAGFPCGFHGAGVYRLPEQMRPAFGNHRNPAPPMTVA